MTERIWLKSYPAGIPADIDISGYGSVLDFFDETIRKYTDKPAFSNFGKHLSFSRLDEMSQAFAGYLQKLGGLQQGDRVAIMMPNLLQYPVVLFGILRAGMTVVNINPLFTARELNSRIPAPRRSSSSRISPPPCRKSSATRPSSTSSPRRSAT